MATKRTGNPRGRPRKVKPTVPPRNPWRPKIPLVESKDRLHVVASIVLQALGCNEHKSARLAESFLSLREVEPPKGGIVPEGFVAVSFEQVKATGNPSKPLLERIEGRVATIRNKRRTLTENDRVWLESVSAALFLSIASNLSARQMAGAIALLAQRANDPSMQLFGYPIF
jgi:hypothetical protein